VFLSSIIHAHVDDIFPGMEVKGCYQFRVTRNSDLFVDEEEVDDLRARSKGELAQRRYGDAVRLETSRDCPDEMVAVPARSSSIADARRICTACRRW
jgi:polyphosphate kinase